MTSLQHLLASASLLIDPSEQDADKTLAERITQFYSSSGKQSPTLTNYSIHDLQLETAKCAIDVLQHVQQLLDNVSNASDDRPAIGVRDSNLLRTLLTIVFRWGIKSLLERVVPMWSTKQHATPTLGEHSSSLADLSELFTLLTSLMSILFPRGVHAPPPRTLITATILDRHMPDLLIASIALGWLPRSLASEDLSLPNLRQPVLRLLEFLPLPQVMTDLGRILSHLPPPPSHVCKVCSSLLTTSLLRPGGVRALFAAVFGEQEGPEDPQLEKYERTAGILKLVPAGHKPEKYFAIIIPSLMDLLSDDVSVTYRRATSFVISRMLDSGFAHRTLVSSLVLPIIHLPMTQTPADSTRTQEGIPATISMTPSRALSALTILLLNTDPSPVLITVLLSPVVPALYALTSHLDKMKTSDPTLKESVKGLLTTWGRLVERQEGVDTLESILQAKRIYWEVDITGEIKHGSSEKPTKLSLLTPKDLKRGTEAVVENPLDLYPDPAHFVEYIKSFNRPDIASELFVRFLEAYHSARLERDEDPSRVLSYLQIILEMQARLSDDSSPSNVLRKPEHVLLFIKHSLGSQRTSATATIPDKPVHSRGLGLDDLRIVDDAEDRDSDDEDPGVDNQAGDNITETAINLLLAVLEANPELSARNAPVLNEIFTLLEPLSSDALASIRTLAREARMVMTARLASTSTSWPAPRGKDEESPQEIYQKALKLLQDPILPVRAHGLLLLRQLVSSRPDGPSHMAKPALVPAIMSIFMQSVQDDDSYIFLNAVQGLSAMVDAFGKEVLSNLLETYTRNVSGVSGVSLSKQEVDAKVRVGEALGQVIRRCGDALSVHADIIVPRLISVFRASHAPTVLRTSAISLLAECVKTSLVAVLRYTNDLTTGMIDLLQVEMVSTPQSQSQSRGEGEAEKHAVAGEHEEKEMLDSKPTAVDAKLPPLRRAALHFWTLLVQQLTRAVYDGAMLESLPTTFLRRAKVTLGYIAAVDADSTVRVMAREANEAIDQLNKAVLGL